MKKGFKPVDGDIDYSIHELTVSGRVTKKRYKVLESYCRKKSYRSYSCGHEWDCCGCCTGEDYELQIIRIANINFGFKITHTIGFNY